MYGTKLILQHIVWGSNLITWPVGFRMVFRVYSLEIEFNGSVYMELQMNWRVFYKDVLHEAHRKRVSWMSLKAKDLRVFAHLRVTQTSRWT